MWFATVSWQRRAAASSGRQRRKNTDTLFTTASEVRVMASKEGLSQIMEEQEESTEEKACSGDNLLISLRGACSRRTMAPMGSDLFL